MTMGGRDDDDGQYDGEVRYQANPMQSQPWMRGSSPPWHLWGNTQQITVPIETTGAIRAGVTNQLVRIAYKRPETWHWLFSARLISGPANTPGFFTRIFVHWELTTGIGRSATMVHFGANGAFAQPGFDDYTFQWGPVNTPFPVGAHIWSTEAQSPSKSFVGDGPNTLGPIVNQIVSQDLQLQVQIVGLTVSDNVLAAGQRAVVEVSAQFAPKTHVRPDWLQLDVPPEAQFSGEEVGGS